ncbi:MAG: adenosine deaminase [Vallitalea sp.]|nr:adenosine deaminase [Vallitalea sp.]
MEKLITGIPKAEAHLHLESSTMPKTVIWTSQKNNIQLPFKTEDEMLKYLKSKTTSLTEFLICDRLVNSCLIYEEDYARAVYDLAEEGYNQNIIYREIFLDYPLNQVRGVSLETYMNGCEKGRKKAQEDFGVEIVFIPCVDRTVSSESSLQFVKDLLKYRDIIDGLGMDCDEKNYPATNHKEAFELAKENSLFLTAHCGEDLGYESVIEALDSLKLDRLDHGIRAVESKELMRRLADEKIMLTTCPYANIDMTIYKDLSKHPLRELMANNVVCSINSDDPPYATDLINTLRECITAMNLTEKEVVSLLRNCFEYSIKGQRYLEKFDKWIKENCEE